MLSDTLPTGTVGASWDDGRTSREARSRRSTRSEREAELLAEVERLRRELARAEAEKQALIDRYERILQQRPRRADGRSPDPDSLERRLRRLLAP